MFCNSELESLLLLIFNNMCASDAHLSGYFFKNLLFLLLPSPRRLCLALSKFFFFVVLFFFSFFLYRITQKLPDKFA